MRAPNTRRVPKEYRPLIRAAERQGWRVQPPRTKGFCGVKLFSPDGVTVISVHWSPSKGKRSFENTRAAFKRAGVKV